MTTDAGFDPSSDSALAESVRQACGAFLEAWQAGATPQIEEFLARVEAADRASALRRLLRIERDWRLKRGKRVNPVDYRRRFLDLAAVVDETFRDLAAEETAGAHVDPSASTLLPQGAAPQTGPPAAISAEGSQIGEYELLEEIGRGGMGVVYKARHVRLRKIVALKLLPPHLACDPAALQRFDREMRVLGQLDHINLVEASDAGESNGRRFLVMRFIQGVTLDRLVRSKGPLSSADACEVIRQAARGLDHAWQLGLVHRDIKPSNLMLAADGVVKVLDMGVATLLRDPTETGLTKTGQIVGTTDYMSPEQIRHASKVDCRADLYSLGCTLFHLLAGRAPFSGSAYTDYVAKAAAQLNDPLPALNTIRDDVPQEVHRILARMTAKDPAARFQSPAELAAALAPHCRDANLSCIRHVSPNEMQPARPEVAAVQGLPSLLNSLRRGWQCLKRFAIGVRRRN